ncbi:MAG: PhoH family protein [Proteobacteria bacterium]|nr:PhoH family protein [Pseudomonadota bacterium]
MNKRFILDTNVLLHDPSALERFGDEEVVVPIYAIEEIDRFKRELSERGRHARVVARRLDDLRRSGPLSQGVSTAGGGRLRVAFIDGHGDDRTLLNRPAGGSDDLILALALQERRRDPHTPVIFVTRDVNLRIRADAMGLQAEDYLDESVDISELYSGVAELELDGELIDRLAADGTIPQTGLFANQYAILRARGDGQQSLLARYDCEHEQLEALDRRRTPATAWGLRARNKEQRFALDLLLRDDVKLVTLVGKAGTGKTLLAIAAGLQKVVEERKYRKLLVSRPIFPLGRDLGFLPGDVEAKLNPWMQPIYDNLDLLLGLGHGEAADEARGEHGEERAARGHRGERSARDARPERGDRGERGVQEFVALGYVEVEPLTYIRGRSIPNQFIIVDEAQNLTPHEVKTIITRVGENTKIVLTGDPYQIDNPYVDSSNNGLATVVERFKGKALGGHITLIKGERSPLAELAANVL